MDYLLHLLFTSFIMHGINALMPDFQSPENGKFTKISMVEDCVNAKDDDNDGLIDLNDPDCDCPVIEPVSLIPNPSFEKMDCCPTGRGELYCAETWLQASEATTDYIHNCGYGGWPNFPPPRPFPDGEGIIGFRDGRVIQGNREAQWKEYAGACLLSPLLNGTEYRFEFDFGFVNSLSSPPLNIALFGTPNCLYLPFGVAIDDFGCPTNGPNWIRLASTFMNGNGWIKGTFVVTPEVDITAIVIGPDCQETTSDQSTYYFFDNLVLADQFSFDFVIDTIKHPCSPDFSLFVPFKDDVEYQWYKDGIALVGQVENQTSPQFGEGNYQVRITANNDCKVTSIYKHKKPFSENFVNHTICDFELFQFGDTLINTQGNYEHIFTDQEGCDSIVKLELTVLGKEYDSIEVYILSGDQFQLGGESFKQEGNYDVSLSTLIGCDSLVNIELKHYHLFFPNVFTPNGDGRNDYFNAYGRDEFLSVKELHVYDRWGSPIFKQENIPLGNDFGWNGKKNDEFVLPGVYVFGALMNLANGEARWFKGTVTVLY